MPSKCSQCRGAPSAGVVNSVRYHQATRYGLSSGIGPRENTLPIGYDMPASERRFIPTYGFLNSPPSTRAPTTVEGTVAADQEPVLTPGCESAAPSASTLADDWIRHPVFS